MEMNMEHPSSQRVESPANWRERLVRGKARMRQRCVEAALKNTPACVSAIRISRSLTGYASSDGIMCVPRPITRKALYVFLHECGHFELGHVILGEGSMARKPRHVEEFEAERWARAKMRQAGIPVPRECIWDAKRNVAFRIRMARERGAARIDRAAARFARDAGNR